jgi:cytochrome c-type biogenesis protein CcmF
MGPLGLLLILLIGICPLIDWREISGRQLLGKLWVQVVVAFLTAVLLVVFGVREAWAVVSFAVTAFVAATIVLQMALGIRARMRTAKENVVVATGRAVSMNRRRYGGQLIHFSILLIVIGITGSKAYQNEWQVPLAVAESIEVGGYTLTYQDYTYQELEDDGAKVRNQAVLDVYRGGRKLVTVRPERNLHSNVQGAVTEVALHSNLKEDLYVILAGLDPDGLAAFQVIVNPLVIWLWIGGAVLIAGTLIAAWPPRRRRR